MYTGINTLIGFSVCGGVGIIGNTPPLHGGISGSSPLLSTIISREDRYLDGAHNPVLVGSTPAPATIGAVAHQGERIPCTDEVAGSIPVSSTNLIYLKNVRKK